MPASIVTLPIDATIWDHRAQPGASPPSDRHVIGIELRGTHRLAAHFDGELRWEDASPPGGVTFTPAGLAARWEAHSPVRVLTVSLDPALTSEIAETHAVGYLPYPVVARPNPQLRAACFRALDRADDAMHREETALDVAGALIEFQLRARRETRGAATLTVRQRRAILDRIHDGLHDQLSVGQLAAAAGLTRYHFSRAFRAAFGETPWQFVRRTRVERAMQLLASGRRSVLAVASDVGFTSASHFAQAFRDVAGVSPTRYRTIVSAPIARWDDQTAAD